MEEVTTGAIDFPSEKQRFPTFLHAFRVAPAVPSEKQRFPIVSYGFGTPRGDTMQEVTTGAIDFPSEKQRFPTFLHAFRVARAVPSGTERFPIVCLWFWHTTRGARWRR